MKGSLHSGKSLHLFSIFYQHSGRGKGEAEMGVDHGGRVAGYPEP